jgi:hypothetical protein
MSGFIASVAAAVMYWLTNRQKEKWKHRVSSEATGESGGATTYARASRTPAQGADEDR